MKPMVITLAVEDDLKQGRATLSTGALHLLFGQGEIKSARRGNHGK
jgi:hypothetical protein